MFIVPCEDSCHILKPPIQNSCDINRDRTVFTRLLVNVIHYLSIGTCSLGVRNRDVSPSVFASLVTPYLHGPILCPPVPSVLVRHVIQSCTNTFSDTS